MRFCARAECVPALHRASRTLVAVPATAPSMVAPVEARADAAARGGGTLAPSVTVCTRTSQGVSLESLALDHDGHRGCL